MQHKELFWPVYYFKKLFGFAFFFVLEPLAILDVKLLDFLFVYWEATFFNFASMSLFEFTITLGLSFVREIFFYCDSYLPTLRSNLLGTSSIGRSLVCWLTDLFNIASASFLSSIIFILLCNVFRLLYFTSYAYSYLFSSLWIIEFYKILSVFATVLVLTVAACFFSTKLLKGSSSKYLSTLI